MVRRLIAFAGSLFACLLSGIVVTGPAVAGEHGDAPIPTRSSTIDLQLGEGGRIDGRVVNRQGHPVPNAHVAAFSGKGKLASAKTDSQGRFVISGLETGARILNVGRHVQAVRLWSPVLAPPSARQQVMLVVGSTERGQCDANCGGCAACTTGAGYAGHAAGYPGHFGGLFQKILRNPWLVAAGTAAAIAIPLAVDDDDAS